MADEFISQQEIDRIGAAVRAWARQWGEDSPRNIRVVTTTRDAATRAISPPGARSSDAIVYFVVLEGDFILRREDSTQQRTGVWAALFLDRETLAASYTVRPPEYVPEYDLDSLGTVHVIP